MTHPLSISSARRSPVLHMQFVAPLRTADAFCLAPEAEPAPRRLAAQGASAISFAAARSHLVTVALLAVAWGGVALWQFA